MEGKSRSRRSGEREVERLKMTDSDPIGCDLTSLGPEDGLALDTILSGRGGGGGTVPSQVDEERQSKVLEVLALLDEYPVEDAPIYLTARTMERVHMARERERFSHQIADLSGPAFTFRIGDLLAVAAAVLICASLAIPMLSQNRTDANRIACASHQNLAGRGVFQYAADHGQMMPRGAVRKNGVWYNVGKDAVGPDGNIESNSAHLRLIVRYGYVHANTLNCPGNPAASFDTRQDAVDWQDSSKISFSYITQYGDPIRIDRNSKVTILTDKNPLFRIYTGPKAQLEFLGTGGNIENISALHQEAGGQNVLYSDGSVDWTTRPVNRAGDNLWVIRGPEGQDKMDYDGTEVPVDPDDAFHIP